MKIFQEKKKYVYYVIFNKSLFGLFRIYISQFSQSICATILVLKSPNEEFYLWTLWCLIRAVSVPSTAKVIESN